MRHRIAGGTNSCDVDRVRKSFSVEQVPGATTCASRAGSAIITALSPRRVVCGLQFAVAYPNDIPIQIRINDVSG